MSEIDNQQPTGQISQQKPKRNIKKLAYIVIAILLVVGLGYLGAQYLVGGEDGLFSRDSTNGSDVQEEIIEFDDGTTERVTPGLADDFPSQVPIFEPSTAIDTARIDYADENEGTYWDAIFETDSSSEEVDGFYRNAFVTNGWEIIDLVEVEDAIDISAYNSSIQLRAGVLIVIGEEGDEETEFTLYAWEELEV